MHSIIYKRFFALILISILSWAYNPAPSFASRTPAQKEQSVTPKKKKRAKKKRKKKPKKVHKTAYYGYYYSGLMIAGGIIVILTVGAIIGGLIVSIPWLIIGGLSHIFIALLLPFLIEPDPLFIYLLYAPYALATVVMLILSFIFFFLGKMTAAITFISILLILALIGAIYSIGRGATSW